MNNYQTAVALCSLRALPHHPFPSMWTSLPLVFLPGTILDTRLASPLSVILTLSPVPHDFFWVMPASSHSWYEQGLSIVPSHNPARTFHFLGTQLRTSYWVWPGTHPAGTVLTSWQSDSNCWVRCRERVVVGGPVAPLGREAPMSVPTQQRPRLAESPALQRGGCPSVPTPFYHQLLAQLRGPRPLSAGKWKG